MGSRLVILSSALLLAACAPTIKSAARQASEVAVDKSVKEATSEKNKGELQQAAHDPRVEEATAKLSEQIAEGIVRSLAEPQTREQLAAVTGAAAASGARELLRELGSQQAQAVLRELTRATTDRALDALEARLHDDLGPALRAVLREDVARGVAGGLADGELRQSLAATSQWVAHGAMLGVGDALSGSWSDPRSGAASGLGSWARRGQDWLTLGLGLASLLALSLFAAALVVLAQARRTRLEITRLESAAVLMAAALREQRGTPESDALLSAVQGSLERSAASHRGPWWDALRLRHHQRGG
jgi:hypothetical protein